MFPTAIRMPAILTLSLALASIATPRGRDKVYDHIGLIVVNVFPSDYYFHGESGETGFSFHCNVDEVSVDCLEGTGIFYSIRLDDGSKHPLGQPLWQPLSIGFYDPLRKLIDKSTALSDIGLQESRRDAALLASLKDAQAEQKWADAENDSEASDRAYKRYREISNEIDRLQAGEKERASDLALNGMTLATFRYRLARSAAGFPAICVLRDVTDKKGRIKHFEACYLTTGQGTSDNKF